jgi:hypothetical protein
MRAAVDVAAPCRAGRILVAVIPDAIIAGTIITDAVVGSSSAAGRVSHPPGSAVMVGIVVVVAVAAAPVPAVRWDVRVDFVRFPRPFVNIITE